MAFWGVEVKPGKPFKLRYEDVNGRLYLAQATLGIGTSTKKSILQCKVGDGKPIFLCTLLPDKIETCPLNLEFEENDVVKFTVIGPSSIHLSGVVRGAEEEGDEDDYDSDMYGEDIYGTHSEESSYSDSEEDPFGVSEDDMFPSPARPSGVVIEEIVDEGSAAKNVKTKLTKGERDQSQGSKDEDKALQIVTKGSTTSPVLQSEDEDGFPVPSSNRSETGTQKAEGNTDAVKPERASEKTKREQKKQKKADLGKQDGPGEKSSKRKADAVVNDESGKSDSTQVNDSSLPTEALPGESMKQKNKKKKKKNREAVEEHVARHEDKSDAKQTEAVADPDSNVNNDTGAANGSASDEQKKGKKKKKGKSQDSQGAVGDKNTITVVSDKSVSIPEEGAKTPKGKPSKIREYSNGLAIEKLEMGKPDGKRASPGKKLKVKYIGKLQKNGQIFDSNINKAPFTFRLGVGAVIKGWDVGVEGMRVGDKRRLTIPPQMGYGAKGAPSKIPPNSWLVFDVELIDVS